MANIILPTYNLEDSIVLMYRSGAADDWYLYPYFTKTMGTLPDKFGTISIDSLKQGEYTIGRIDHTVGIKETNLQNDLIKIYPNPSSSEFTVDLTGISNTSEITLEVYDISGKEIFSQKYSNTKIIKVDDHKWSAGTYILNVRGRDGIVGRKKVVVK